MKNFQSIRGMHDCIPKDVLAWQDVEHILKTILNSYGYNEIRLPIIESADLFIRSIGEITDVVEKEMYNFKDQNGDNLALRPEGTSGCVRAGIEHSLFYHQEQRLWYVGPMFRRERPQKGRYRQFHQFSAEVFGQIGPDIDAELILITFQCWKALGISQNIRLELNSLGLLSSRIQYKAKLIDFLEKNRHSLNDTAIRRLYSNPMRILDMKNNKIKELLVNAPIISDYLDDDSRKHFLKLCELLNFLEISYTINPYLVRGLDYYNRTIFEWVTDNLGVKKTICAGGRYDNLTNQLGGSIVPAIGFSIGLERVLLLMKSINHPILNRNTYVDVYLMYIGYSTEKYSMILSNYIRKELPFLKLMVNHGGGTLKQQFNRASKNNAKVIVLVDDQSVNENIVLLKDLKSGNQEILKFDNIILKLNDIFKNKI